MDVCALFLLLGGVCRLEKEDGLGGKEDAGRVEELSMLLAGPWAFGTPMTYGMGREEHERRHENGCPYRGCELEGIESAT